MLATTTKAHNAENFARIQKINVFGTFLCAKHATILLRKLEVEGRERGVFICVSSVAGHMGQRGHLAYSVSKGAIRGMILPMARDLGRLKIRVLAIAPGVIITEMSNYK